MNRGPFFRIFLKKIVDMQGCLYYNMERDAGFGSHCPGEQSPET